MEKFTLLIDGKDLDTEVYEYFPYADKYISDFKTTFRILTQLKMGKIFEDSPEANEYIFAKYCVGKEDTNSKAIESAYKASKVFRYFPVAKRRKILYDIHKYLIQKKEELIKLLIIEGHPRKLAEWEFSGMERSFCKESLDLFKNELWKEVGYIDGETIYWARKPDGVVCVNPPRNAPTSSLGAAFALLGGNTLIIKPPLKLPLFAIFLWKEVVNRALEENGAPKGSLNIVLGNSEKITKEWLLSPYVNDIFYIGDSRKGLEIGKGIFEANKKPILELSGNDMLFIWKDCDLEGALASALDAFLGSTQICMVPKKIIIHEDIYGEFIPKFLEKVKNLKVGLPSDEETYLSPVMGIDKFFEFLNDALEKGAKLLCGGSRIDYKGNIDQNGIYIQPTVIVIEDDKKAFDLKCVRDENFFPLLPIIKVSSDKQGKAKDKVIFNKMINIADLNEYGLRVSAWVSSYTYIRKFIKYLESGLLRINSRHVDFSYYLPAQGGIRKTGGPFGEMNYVWQKTTHLQGISLTRKQVVKRRRF
ncbi:MAG: aldehyde dehydrogenase family protein [Candidatus Omnitrophica bacterium]|nr:aldehyde dehydrogenase family protein [Candidatus Omnitrophota bacterium]